MKKIEAVVKPFNDESARPAEVGVTV